PLERLVGHLVDRRVHRVAGVVDDDVQLSERLDGRLDELVGHALLRQVAGENRRLTLDLSRGLLGHVAVQVVDEDLRALLREQLRRGASTTWTATWPSRPRVRSRARRR